MRPLIRISIALLCSALFGWAAEKSGIALDPSAFPSEMKAEVQQVDIVFRKFPDDASVLYQVASLHARAGHSAQALAALHRMADLDAGLQPRPRDFPGLEKNKEFLQIGYSIQRKNPAKQNARLAYVVPEGDLVPEGIAWSQMTHKFYLGSVKRKIVALAEDGSVQDFVRPGSDGLGVVLGLRVDDQRGELWAVSESIGPKPSDLVVGVFRYKLSDGSLIHAYRIESAKPEMLNDLAVAKDGSVYVTATIPGALYRINGNSNQVEKFLPDGSLPDPNGITLDPDEKSLFVAGWYGISRVNLKNKKIDLLEKPNNIADGCIDGLYWFGKSDLIGVQNCNDDPGRILDFHLMFESKIEKVTVLESYNPMFDGVTTAAITGDQLYFMANTQLHKLDKEGRPAGAFDALKILRLNLK